MTSRITNCDCSHWRLFTCPLPTVFVVCHSFRRGYLCVGRGGMVTKHRFKNSSLHDWKSFFSLSVFVRCDPLYDTVSACVWCHSKLWSITNTGSDGTSGTFQSSGGPRPLSKLSHWKTAPLPFNNTHHQRDTGRGEREGEGEGRCSTFRPHWAVVLNSIPMVLPSENGILWSWWFAVSLYVIGFSKVSRC